jgi:spore maturation protein CgeB
MTLNLTRGEMAASGYCPSGRFFEAAACGTPIVTDYFDGLESFFDLGRELIVVDNAGDVVNAMGRDDSSLAHLANQARERTLSLHTGQNRADELLLYLDEASRKTPPAIKDNDGNTCELGAAS